jgi:hypothetical protein
VHKSVSSVCKQKVTACIITVADPDLLPVSKYMEILLCPVLQGIMDSLSHLPLISICVDSLIRTWLAGNLQHMLTISKLLFLTADTSQ